MRMPNATIATTGWEAANAAQQLITAKTLSCPELIRDADSHYYTS